MQGMTQDKMLIPIQDLILPTIFFNIGIPAKLSVPIKDGRDEKPSIWTSTASTEKSAAVDVDNIFHDQLYKKYYNLNSKKKLKDFTWLVI